MLFISKNGGVWRCIAFLSAAYILDTSITHSDAKCVQDSKRELRIPKETRLNRRVVHEENRN